MSFHVLFRLGSTGQPPEAGFKSPLAFWLGGAAQGAAAEEEAPAPTPTPEGGGVSQLSTPRGPYAPAFRSPRRSMADLYQQAPIERAQEKLAEDKPQEAEPEPRYGPSPLPLIMDFGSGPIALGIEMPSLTEAIHEQLLLDDEDAIIAIILSQV